MPSSSKCRLNAKNRKNQVEYQKYPQNGALLNNLDLQLRNFKQQINIFECKQDIVYLYIIDTLRFIKTDKKFIQTGTGPNFQGDRISLCTCKHLMRTYPNVINNEQPLWIAGFSGRSKVYETKKANYLFYLMRVNKRYANHADAWQSLEPQERDAKNAASDRFGDIFMPKKVSLSNKEKVDPRFYQPPIFGHPHKKKSAWKDDVRKCYDREFALIFGDKNFSFIWTQPRIRWSDLLPRKEIFMPLGTFLRQLKQ